MKGFIKIQDNEETSRLVPVSQIKQVVCDDKVARIYLLDGTSIKTSFRHNVDDIENLITEAT